MSSQDDPNRDCARLGALRDRLAGQCPRGLALVVDDNPVSRILLLRMLSGEGFTTLEADCGEDALNLFAAERPDLVFMDAELPRMDGFETTRRLKAMAGDDFVPVIFVSGLHDDDALAACIHAGGDDFLIKPYTEAALKARILAMERMRDLQRTFAANNRLPADILEQELQEQALAERVFNRAIRNRNVTTELMGLMQRPAAMFSGDLVLTQHLPDGGLRVLVGDFTGRGLAATIGALPVAEAFHAMTMKGVEDAEVLSELNHKLHALLPADRFMAACLISIPGSGRSLRWWNGGMAGIWLRTQDSVRSLASHALPLGILPQLSDVDRPRKIGVQPGDSLLMFTDGLLGAVGEDGRAFEESALQSVLAGWKHGEPIFPALVDALDRHCGSREQSDDIAVLEIPLGSHLFAIPEPVHQRLPAGGWSWSVELRDEQLTNLRSVESMLGSLGLLDGLGTHLPILETIVTELYANALEHGVRRSSGFRKATSRRGEEPAHPGVDPPDAGVGGWIRLEISYQALGQGGGLKVSVTDSGAGFQCGSAPDESDYHLPPRPWGEGVSLLHELCNSLVYRRGGSQVEAVYCW